MKVTTLEKLQELTAGYQKARIIQTAVKLRIFDATRAGKPVDAVGVAASAGISVRGADILLDALSALGLLEKSGNHYENSALAEKNLVSGSGSMLIHSIDHSEQIYRRWAYLPESVKDGRAHGSENTRVVDNPEANRVFIHAMHARGLHRGRQIAAGLDLTGVKKVGDVGGGAGSYLIALAERIPEMQGYLFDVKLTLQTAGEIIHTHDPALQFHLIETDLVDGEVPFGEDFDLMLLSNILHIFGPDQNIQILKRIKQSLKEGGRLVIQDFLLDDSGTEPPGAAFFAVNMLTGTESGRAWRETDVRRWIHAAGFTHADRQTAGTGTDILVVS